MSNPDYYTFKGQYLHQLSETFQDLLDGKDPVDFMIENMDSIEEGSDFKHKIADLGAGPGTMIRQLELEFRNREIRDGISFENVSMTDLRIDEKDPTVGPKLTENDNLWDIKYTLSDVDSWIKAQPFRSIDYINTSHLLEHVENPLQTITNALTKLKYNGALFCSAEFLTKDIDDDSLNDFFNELEYAHYTVKAKKHANGWAFIIIK